MAWISATRQAVLGGEFPRGVAINRGHSAMEIPDPQNTGPIEVKLVHVVHLCAGDGGALCDAVANREESLLGVRQPDGAVQGPWR